MCLCVFVFRSNDNRIQAAITVKSLPPFTTMPVGQVHIYIYIYLFIYLVILCIILSLSQYNPIYYSPDTKTHFQISSFFHHYQHHVYISNG